jgi:RimJ/RimL family protein N-acetyltransferase
MKWKEKCYALFNSNEMIHNKHNLLLFGEETERLIFRKVEPTDFEAWLEFCREKDALKYIFSQADQLLPPEEKCHKWFDRVQNRYENQLGGMNALIEKSTGKLVGQIGLLIQTIDGVEELEIGYSLLAAHRGKGFAIEAAQKCKQVAIERQAADSLISVIIPENVTSIAVAEKNGMKLDKITKQNEEVVGIWRIEI